MGFEPIGGPLFKVRFQTKSTLWLQLWVRSRQQLVSTPPPQSVERRRKFMLKGVELDDLSAAKASLFECLRAYWTSENVSVDWFMSTLFGGEIKLREGSNVCFVLWQHICKGWNRLSCASKWNHTLFSASLLFIWMINVQIDHNNKRARSSHFTEIK